MVVKHYCFFTHYVNNKDKHVALFIPDEPRELVLIKLTCITHNIDARVLEQRVANHDQEAINLLHQNSKRRLPKPRRI
jgi:hypothetical protein